MNKRDISSVTRAVTIALTTTFLIVVMAALTGLLFARQAADSQRLALEQAQVLVNVERLRFYVEATVSTKRAYLITSIPVYLSELEAERAQVQALLDDLYSGAPSTRSRRLIMQIRTAESHYQEAFQEFLQLPGQARQAQVIPVFLERMKPRRDLLLSALDALSRHKTLLLDQHIAQSREVLKRAFMWMALSALLALLLAGIISLQLTRKLNRMIAQEIEARQVAEAFSSEIREQSSQFEHEFQTMRNQKEAAEARVTQLEPRAPSQ